MSPSTLHEHFKEATSVSPMQFVKSLRLPHAHTLLLSGNHNQRVLCIRTLVAMERNQLQLPGCCR